MMHPEDPHADDVPDGDNVPDVDESDEGPGYLALLEEDDAADPPAEKKP